MSQPPRKKITLMMTSRNACQGVGHTHCATAKGVISVSTTNPWKNSTVPMLSWRAPALTKSMFIAPKKAPPSAT